MQGHISQWSKMSKKWKSMPNGHRSKLKNSGKWYFIQEKKDKSGDRYAVLNGFGNFSESNFYS